MDSLTRFAHAFFVSFDRSIPYAACSFAFSISFLCWMFRFLRLGPVSLLCDFVTITLKNVGKSLYFTSDFRLKDTTVAFSRSPATKDKIFLYCFLRRKLMRAPDCRKNSKYQNADPPGLGQFPSSNFSAKNAFALSP
jgi:hypothetical protein